MEMAGSEAVNMPKTYSLNMFKDFVPMCVFSETSQGENRNLRFIPFVVFTHQWQVMFYICVVFYSSIVSTVLITVVVCINYLRVHSNLVMFLIL